MEREQPPVRPTIPISPRWKAPLLWANWGMEWGVYYASRIALFEVLEYVGKLSLLVAVATYFIEIPQRREQARQQKKQTHYQAWQIINSAKGLSGDGGRTQAIQDLNKDGVEMVGIPCENAYMNNLQVPGAKLRRANFRNADLRWANFANGDLRNADLQGADLRDANLSGADLLGASLLNTKFQGANFAGTKLDGADVKNAVFQGAKNLTIGQIKVSNHWNTAIFDKDFGKGSGYLSSDLRNVDFEKADLRYTNLEGYDLRGAKLFRANLKGVGLAGVDLESAKLGYASIGGASLRKAKLRHANLSFANRPVPPWLDQQPGYPMAAPQMGPERSKSLDVQLVEFQGAELQDADLSNSDFQGADFTGADLARAIMVNADLFNANLLNANLDGTNLVSCENLTPEQVKTAKNWEKANYSRGLRRRLGLPPALPQVAAPIGGVALPPSKMLPESEDSEEPPTSPAPPQAPSAVPASELRLPFVPPRAHLPIPHSRGDDNKAGTTAGGASPPPAIAPPIEAVPKKPSDGDNAVPPAPPRP